MTGTSMTILEVPWKSLKFPKEGLLKLLFQFSWPFGVNIEGMFHKKVLLHDSKRCTTRGISCPWCVLSEEGGRMVPCPRTWLGYPHPVPTPPFPQPRSDLSTPSPIPGPHPCLHPLPLPHPLARTWLGYPLPSLGKDLGPETGTPSLHPLVDKLKTLTSLVLPTRAVKRCQHSNFPQNRSFCQIWQNCIGWILNQLLN